jgi:hypothetical protein
MGRYRGFSEVSNIGRDRDVYKDNNMDRYINVHLVSYKGRMRSDYYGSNIGRYRGVNNAIIIDKSLKRVIKAWIQ